MTDISALEATGPGFVLERLLDVRQRTRTALHDIADRIEVGMLEDDAHTMARGVLAEHGLRRGWHRVITRLGPNTTKDFAAPSEKGVALRPDDIFFIDIGPIYEGYEGDAGETFVVGEDPDHHRAKADAKDIWDEVRATWMDDGPTGRQLYQYAEAAAARRGWKLNLDLSGHRLSNFPHSAHYDGAMADVEGRLAPDRWVLEIAIVHPERPFGAFYEDLLLENQSFD